MRPLSLRMLYTRVRALLWECSGEAEYDRYAQRCAARHELPLDRGRFFARRVEERYRTSGWCC